MPLLCFGCALVTRWFTLWLCVGRAMAVFLIRNVYLTERLFLSAQGIGCALDRRLFMRWLCVGCALAVETKPA